MHDATIQEELIALLHNFAREKNLNPDALLEQLPQVLRSSPISAPIPPPTVEPQADSYSRQYLISLRADCSPPSELVSLKLEPTSRSSSDGKKSRRNAEKSRGEEWLTNDWKHVTGHEVCRGFPMDEIILVADAELTSCEGYLQLRSGEFVTVDHTQDEVWSYGHRDADYGWFPTRCVDHRGVLPEAIASLTAVTPEHPAISPLLEPPKKICASEVTQASSRASEKKVFEDRPIVTDEVSEAEKAPIITEVTKADISTKNTESSKVNTAEKISSFQEAVMEISENISPHEPVVAPLEKILSQLHVVETSEKISSQVPVVERSPTENIASKKSPAEAQAEVMECSSSHVKSPAVAQASTECKATQKPAHPKAAEMQAAVARAYEMKTLLKPEKKDEIERTDVKAEDPSKEEAAKIKKLQQKFELERREDEELTKKKKLDEAKKEEVVKRKDGEEKPAEATAEAKKAKKETKGKEEKTKLLPKEEKKETKALKEQKVQKSQKELKAPKTKPLKKPEILQTNKFSSFAEDTASDSSSSYKPDVPDMLSDKPRAPIGTKKKRMTKAQEMSNQLELERAEPKTNPAKLDFKETKASSSKSVPPTSPISAPIPAKTPSRTKIMSNNGMPASTSTANSTSAYLVSPPKRKEVKEEKIPPELEPYIWKPEKAVASSVANSWLDLSQPQRSNSPLVQCPLPVNQSGNIASVDEFFNMGFDKARATHALHCTNGDVLMAVNLLVDETR